MGGRMMRKQLEQDILKQCLQWLALKGFFCWRSNVGARAITQPNGSRTFVRFGLKGSSDILGLTRQGQFLAIEVKRKGNKPTPEQEAFLSSIRKSGGLAFVVTSVEELEKAMESEQ